MRIQSVDFIRGIAILIMICANAYPYLAVSENCPFALRVLFSSAAPIFIFLSGFSLRLAIENNSTSKKLYLRAFQILFIATFIDTLIWNIAPFYTMDVLYLISYSMLILLLMRSFSWKSILFLALLVFSLTGISSSSYHFELGELTLESFTFEYFSRDIVRHICIDGWFPIIPWMGAALLGYILCERRHFLSKYAAVMLFNGIATFTLFMLSLLLSFHEFNPVRDGYTEIFYPVTLPFMIYMVSLYCLIVYMVVRDFPFNGIISTIGTYSLPIYLIHTVLIKFITPFFTQSSDEFQITLFSIGLSSLYLLIIIYAIILQRVAPVLKQSSYRPIRFLLGL